MKDKKNIIIAILSGIIILGIGYMIGYRNQSKEVPDLPPQPTINESVTSNSTKQTTTSTFKDVELTDKTSENNRNLPTELLPYSDEEIEYARVWLAVMGEDYLDRIGRENFNLNISFVKKGEPLYFPKSELNINWPQDTILLTGNASAQGQIFYSSNFDGSVSVYPMPSHWHQDPKDLADDDYMTKYLNSILSDKKVVPIPAGNPKLVKELVQLEKIYK